MPNLGATLNSAQIMNMMRNMAVHPTAVAIAVSPELYHEVVEHTQAVCSEYLPSTPESLRMPWRGWQGLSVIVDPLLRDMEFALINAANMAERTAVAMNGYRDTLMTRYPDYTEAAK